MIRVYLTYGKGFMSLLPMRPPDSPLDVCGGESVERVEDLIVPPGEERYLLDCEDVEHAVKVMSSWLRDPDTISVRAERK